MLLSLTDLIGHFHPVFVHLPIGILLLACLFQWLAMRPKFAALQPAVPLMFFWGTLGAVLSCISGYLLSQSGDYDNELVSRHQWLGIFTALAALVLYVSYKFAISRKATSMMAVLIAGLITVTGHLGGSLTHGSDYLTKGWQSNDPKGPALKPIPNIQEAAVYADVVQPLLQARCSGCHGPNKQKGKLRLDGPEFIAKGGKDGKVLLPGKADESEMIKRMLLPLQDEDHMPPKEKPQLTAEELSLLHWWISTGADFQKKVKELPQTEKIRPVLLALQSGASGGEQKLADVPEAPVEKASDAVIRRLQNAGVMIVPVAQNSNYLSASFVTAATGADTLVPLLAPLRKQLVWLKLDGTNIGDAATGTLAQLTALTRLQLSGTNLTDKGVANLQTLQQLQSLNLTGTKVTAQGVAQLKGLKSLKKIYLYQTGVSPHDWARLQQVFPATGIDSGKYMVPTLSTDTTKVTALQKQKP